jgi:hypothetical protein
MRDFKSCFGVYQIKTVSRFFEYFANRMGVMKQMSRGLLGGGGSRAEGAWEVQIESNSVRLKAGVSTEDRMDWQPRRSEADGNSVGRPIKTDHAEHRKSPQFEAISGEMKASE